MKEKEDKICKIMKKYFDIIVDYNFMWRWSYQLSRKKCGAINVRKKKQPSHLAPTIMCGKSTK